MADQRRSFCTWIKTTVNKFAISNHTAFLDDYVKNGGPEEVFLHLD